MIDHELDAIMTGALMKTLPEGVRLNTISIKDRIGTLILLRTIRRVAGDALDDSFLGKVALVYATIGASLERPPLRDQSSVEMLNWLD
jgi:hypothetical protein